MVGWETYLFDLVFISLVGTVPVIGEGFWACELVVGGWGGYYVAMASYLPGEAGHWAGHLADGSIGGVGGGDGGERTLIDLTEDDDAGEFGLGEAGDDGMVEVYA